VSLIVPMVIKETVGQNYSTCILTCQGLCHKVQECINQTLKKSLIVALTREIKFQDSYWRTLLAKEYVIVNPKLGNKYCSAKKVAACVNEHANKKNTMF